MPRVARITQKSDVPAEHHAVVDHVLTVFNNIRGPLHLMPVVARCRRTRTSAGGVKRVALSPGMGWNARMDQSRQVRRWDLDGL